MRWDILWRKSWFLIWTMQEKDSHRAAAGDGRYYKRGAPETWCGRRDHRGKLVFHGKRSPEEGDVSLRDEEDYMELAEKGGYYVIFADPYMKRMTKAFSGVFVDTVHFAVSGKCR